MGMMKTFQHQIATLRGRSTSRAATANTTTSGPVAPPIARPITGSRRPKPRSHGPPSAEPADEPRFPIDVVYTWVDGHDPAWRERCAQTLRACDRATLNGQAATSARFRNRDELRFSLRSLARHAPFVRNVYIVTSGQVPPWLDLDVPNVRVVPHEEILDPDCLPTFNSHAIETALHRIEGLAEHYLYLNDDFFFGGDCTPSMFFTPDGKPRFFPDDRGTVPSSPASPSDRPVDSATKNTRDLMSAELGMWAARKMQHAPYPQRRSILAEMEERLPLAFKQTARNPFRHYTDVNIASCCSHHYAYATNAAVPGSLRVAYINIGSPWAPLLMNRLLQRRDRHVFCLNDSQVSPKRAPVVDAAVSAFLEARFPEPGPFERAQ